MGHTCFDVQLGTADGLPAGVAHLVLSRPDAFNTMVPEFWGELPRIVADLDASGDCRAIVISSTGKHFSAGMDLAVFSGQSSLLGGGGVSEEGRKRSVLWMAVQHLQETFTAMERARMPVLAAVQGGCIGGAVDMVCAADMRFATEQAFFCIQEINIGMTADVGTLQRLPKLIAEGVAREWAYTGDRIPAARAKEVGFVNEVYASQDEMIEAVLGIAGRIAAHSPLAVWGTKEMLNYTRDHSVADSLRYMAGWQSGMFVGGDMLEEFTAKAEGRTPSFEDVPARPEPW